MSKQSDSAKLEAIEKIRAMVKPGDTVYTVLRHVSRSGMYRVIDVYVMKENVPLRLSWGVAEAIGAKYDRRHEGVGVSGCGSDMGFEVVYSLGRALWPKGFDTAGFGRECTNQKCKGYADKLDGRTSTCPKCGAATRASYRRNGPCEFDTDGGYALIQRWR